MCVTRKSAKCIQYTLWCMKNYRIETHIANSEWNKYTEIEQLTISAYDKTLAVHEFNSIELNCNIRFPPCSQSLQWAPFIFLLFCNFNFLSCKYRLFVVYLYVPTANRIISCKLLFFRYLVSSVLVMVFFFTFLLTVQCAYCVMTEKVTSARSLFIRQNEYFLQNLGGFFLAQPQAFHIHSNHLCRFSAATAAAISDADLLIQ